VELGSIRVQSILWKKVVELGSISVQIIIWKKVDELGSAPSSTEHPSTEQKKVDELGSALSSTELLYRSREESLMSAVTQIFHGSTHIRF